MKQVGMVLGIIALPVVLAACSSIISVPQRPQHVLLKLHAQMPSKQCSSKARPTIAVNPVQVLPQYDQESFVYRLQDQQYATDYYHQFFLPPGQQLRQLTTNALKQGCWQIVTPGVNYTGRPDYQLSAQLISLYADYRHPKHPRAIMAIHYYLINDDKQQVVFDKTYHENLAIQPGHAQDLLKQWTKASQHIVKQLVADLHS